MVMLQAVVAIMFLLVCYLIISAIKPSSGRLEEQIKKLEEKIDKLSEYLRNK